MWAVSSKGEDIASHFNDLIPELALEFPFELDAFQKEVFCLSTDDSGYFWREISLLFSTYA